MNGTNCHIACKQTAKSLSATAVASQCLCNMLGGALAACVCAALAVQLSCAQDTFVNVSVTDQDYSEQDEAEYSMVAELLRELKAAKSDALQLYTEYTGQAGRDMKGFMLNITLFAQDALRAVEKRPTYGDPWNCKAGFESRLRKVEKDAYKAASFSSENHHKFLLGHMVVFRMHINKTEDYIRKCERALNGCSGAICENKPKVKRWKRQAMKEIHRVKDDIEHTRRSFKDLVTHAKRRLNHIRNQIYMSTSDAVENYHKCLDGAFRY